MADLGAGTIDLVGAAGDVVAAGAGALLTAAVAAATGLPRAAADWVKRGPSVRLGPGRQWEAEDGTRGFLTRPAPAGATGMLAVPGPAGWLPWAWDRAPSEWRALRLRLKEAIMGANLARCLAGAAPEQLVLVGGAAEDDELVGVLAGLVPAATAVGRARVGHGLGDGIDLGCRYAAALGLALSAGG